MIELAARPLAPASYAPYGRVVMAAPAGEGGRPANQGTARRFDRLAALENERSSATSNVCVFRCSPCLTWPLEVALLEKHPRSTQLFVPMNARRYLVIVALGADAPDLATLAAFVAGPAQGITYHPGVWHHPMIALDSEIDFACVLHEDGGEEDCEIVEYAAGQRPRITL